jgi:RNA exonuclease 1
MIENDYPIPSYMADIFDKPDGWVEIPQAVPPHERQRSQVYAVDCKMVCRHLSTMRPTQPDTVSDRIRQGTDPGLHHDYESGIVVYDELVKPPKSVIDYHKVLLSLSSSRHTLTNDYLDG